MFSRLYTVIPSDEFNAIVNKHFPTAKDSYNVVAGEEKGNDCAIVSDNVKPIELNDYNKKSINSGKFSFMVHYLFEKLCFDKVIEPGNYIITISW
jgi:hypothetical protein